MNPKGIDKEQFLIVEEDLTKVIDVDDSAGRECPINMNFVEEGHLSKDTGFTIVGGPADVLVHSVFYYKKKDGTSFIIRARGTELESYSFVERTWTRLGTTNYTAGARFGFNVYDDYLYGCNGVDNFFRFDGTTFTEYASAPKGNILEVFEDRMFISGKASEPLTIYYSAVGDPTNWSNTALVLKPLGTDFVTALENYYGQLMIFKQKSIWKMTFVFDQVASAFIPKLELQSGNYGACSRKAVTWVENDLWFFTGREIRSIGYKDNLTGVLGINQTVISEQIKETLYRVSIANYSKCHVGYHNRRFYLSIPLESDENDTTFVCHLLYNSMWTKYVGRDKAKIGDMTVVENTIYSNISSVNFGTLKWDVEAGDSVTLNRALEINA